MRESLYHYCKRLKRDELLTEWEEAANLPLSPQKITYGSRRKVWWRCSKGHTWKATVASRTSSGSGCPYCAGKKVLAGFNDLKTVFPEIAAQWHPVKNDRLTPDKVTPYANRKVWWKCDQGHDYQAIVADRTMKGGGCPYCAGRKALPGFNDLATVFPELAQQWHPTLNRALTPDMVTVGSHYMAWWECSSGHVWKAAVYSRTSAKKCGCPVCARNVSEKRLERYQKALTGATEGM